MFSFILRYSFTQGARIGLDIELYKGKGEDNILPSRKTVKKKMFQRKDELYAEEYPEMKGAEADGNVS